MLYVQAQETWMSPHEWDVLFSLLPQHFLSTMPAGDQPKFSLFVSLLTQPHCRLIVLIPAAVPVILVLGLCLGRFAVDCRGHTGRGGDGDGGGRTSGTLN